MKRLTTVRELRQWQRELSARPRAAAEIRVCSTGCRALGALDVCDALEREVARRGLGEKVRVVRTGCHGLCAGAVAVVVDLSGSKRGGRAGPCDLFYQGVTPDDAPEIVQKTVVEGRPVRRLCWRSGRRVVTRQRNIPFYKHQTRLVLRNCGVVDPCSLEDAVAHGAYQAAGKALAGASPEAVIDEVERSGLRGRGGAGFPTGRKWRFARAAGGQPKFVICNADEGDPGAFMDRALLEGDPHLVIEGMILGAYAIGASKGYIYVRAEYPIAIEHVVLALDQARQAGLLGRDILGSGFAFDIEIRKGAGAYVCGEETALIASIEGKRGTPRPRPPFPATRGLYGKPTSTNNVETLANVPRILEMGAGPYAEIGTGASKGTKIFSLAGQVRHAGLVEVPMGVTLRRIVFDIGGGPPGGDTFKAAQIGGPCGGYLGAEHLDAPLDYESLKDVGAMLGCGGIIVVDQDTCMVDMARHSSAFAVEESCGQCVPCRLGNKRMLEVLTRITEGKGQAGDIDRIAKLARLIDQTSLCGMAPNPVLSTIRYFREEFDAHALERRCPTGACQALAPTAQPAR
jgi:NADH:ubiquinone oxidoreductase subunit F (NADH-binding)/(2Fe-2S) ferredoxin